MPDVPDNEPRPQRVRGEELRRRIEQVRAQLLTGKSRRWVAKLVASEWALKPSQCWLYIRKAEDEIREIVDRNAQDWLAMHLAIRHDIRRRANDQGDLRTELAASDSEAKLLGLMDRVNDPAPNKGDADGPPPVREVVIEHLTEQLPDAGAPERPTDGGGGPDGQPPAPLP